MSALEILSLVAQEWNFYLKQKRRMSNMSPPQNTHTHTHKFKKSRVNLNIWNYPTNWWTDFISLAT